MNALLRECLLPGWPASDDPPPLPRTAALHGYVSRECGATNLYTGMAMLAAGGLIPWHTHPVSEAITVLQGTATVLVESRTYYLGALECILVPAGTPHSVRNDQDRDDHSRRELLVHTTFADANPARHLIAEGLEPTSDPPGEIPFEDPLSLRRFDKADKYDLSAGALFCDFFAKRFGSAGICGGYGRFLPGSSLPCHTHHYDESITIVTGEALCLVEGREYRLRAYDTAYVPEGRAHRFMNVSNGVMAMIWAYAGDEPDRTLMDPACCSDAVEK